MTNQPAAVTVRAVTRRRRARARAGRLRARRRPLPAGLPQPRHDPRAASSRAPTGSRRATRAGVLVHVRDHGGPPLAAYALACSIAWHTRENVLLLARDPERYRELAAFAGADERARGRRSRRRRCSRRPETSRRSATPSSSLFARYATIVVLDRPGQTRLRTAVAVDLVPAGSARPDADALALRAWSGSRRDVGRRDRIYDVPALVAGRPAALRDGLLPTRTPAGKAVGRLAREVTGLTVGLALGSGSLRGYAHFGVLKGVRAGRARGRLRRRHERRRGRGQPAPDGQDARGGRRRSSTASPSRCSASRCRGRGLLSNTGIRSLLREVAGETRDRGPAEAARDRRGRRRQPRRGRPPPRLRLAGRAREHLDPGRLPGAEDRRPYTLVDGGVVNPVPTSRRGRAWAPASCSACGSSPRATSATRSREAMPAKGRPPSARRGDAAGDRHDAVRASTTTRPTSRRSRSCRRSTHVPAAKLRHFRTGTLLSRPG